MARKLSFVPDEGQPPSNPFLDPRTWTTVLGMLAGTLPWLTEDRIGKLSALAAGILAFAVYVYGKWRADQRTAIVDSTLKAVAPANYGETVSVDMPNGNSKAVRVVPANETPPKEPTL